MTNAVTVAAIAAVLTAERAARAARRGTSATTWQRSADTIRNAIVVCNGAIVPTAPPANIDPAPTLPLSQRELFGLLEIDGGRPMHDLDYALRMGGAR
ncbi:hypothetical protein D5S18_18460 [Nocardia panacis]|uniref:Uncharacterized protein n=1 Tax=Nocardia panacis TaxID=2340916 RepID=A0A3A4KHQ9_9NOCA|nr:hypothetical protein D5S18_18460 [Nocardia panacis]